MKNLKDGKIIPISFDYHFVRIFGQDDNMDIIEYFISDFYDIPIEKVIGNIKILSRDLKQNSKIEKNKQVDLLLKLDDKKINIEISNTTSTGRKERDLVYLANIHGQQLHKKKDYSTIGSSWQIRLNNVSCNGGRVRKIYYLMSDDKERKKYSEKFRIDNIDLVAASKIRYNESNEKIVRWCRILRASTREEIVKELGDKLMDKDARDKLLEEVERNSRDDELYDLHEMYSRDEMERRTELIEAIDETTKKVTKEVTDKVTKEVTDKVTKEVTEEVSKQKQLEIAKKLLEKNMSLGDISEVTGLSKEEIEKI